MADSRRSASNDSPHAGGDAPGADRAASDAPVLAALAAWNTRRQPHGKVAVAYSGGLDSTVLLHALLRVLPASKVIALHVQHGLQPAAEAWPRHCAEQATRWGARCEVLSLADAPPSGDSVEQWARQARYRALVSACRQQGVSVLLTAHHADDQIETLFLRLTRGAGLSGLRGIEPKYPRDGIDIERPLLAVPRASLASYARANGLQWVDDPSNADPRFARNALRHQVLPAFDRAMPGFRQVVARNLAHWRAAADTLDELAQADLAPARLAGGAALDRRPLIALTPARQAWAWRAWLHGLGLKAPDTARFAQMQRQLLWGEAAQGRVDHDGVSLLRYRDVVTAVPLAAMRAAAQQMAPLNLTAAVATGTAGARRESRCLDLGPGRGRLWVEPVNDGAVDAGSPGATVSEGAAGALDAAWLRAANAMVVTGSLGAHRQRLRADGPSRQLKHLYQQFGVAPWLRTMMPVVLVGEAVLFSGAFGLDRSARWQSPPPPDMAFDTSGPKGQGTHVRLRWEPDPLWRTPLQVAGFPWAS